VTGAKSAEDAKQIAKTIGTSSLVKTALFGEDANWGRIIAALGRSGVPIEPNRVALAFDRVPIVKAGVGLGRNAERQISRVVRRREFTIALDLGLGSAVAQLWTTDLSYDYVKINASYRS
jgi:glutamate N-acetyltransferase/amino-acid N-acetyltransferase